MRVSVALFLTSLAGMEIGAALIGLWCVGVTLICWSAALGGYALYRDDKAVPVIDAGGVTEERHFMNEVVAQHAKRLGGAA